MKSQSLNTASLAHWSMARNSGEESSVGGKPDRTPPMFNTSVVNVVRQSVISVVSAVMVRIKLSVASFVQAL